MAKKPLYRSNTVDKEAAMARPILEEHDEVRDGLNDLDQLENMA